MEPEEEGNHELVVAAQNNLLSTQQAVDVAARAARAAVEQKAQAERMFRQTSFLADILSSQKARAWIRRLGRRYAWLVAKHVGMRPVQR